MVSVQESPVISGALACSEPWRNSIYFIKQVLIVSDNMPLTLKGRALFSLKACFCGQVRSLSCHPDSSVHPSHAVCFPFSTGRAVLSPSQLQLMFLSFQLPLSWKTLDSHSCTHHPFKHSDQERGFLPESTLLSSHHCRIQAMF